MTEATSGGYGAAFYLALDNGWTGSDARDVTIDDVSARNEVYRLRRGSETLYCKVGPAARREKDAHDILWENGLGDVRPEIVAFDPAVPAVAFEAASGGSLQDHDWPERAWPRCLREVAESLARIGGVPADAGPAAGPALDLPPRLGGVSGWSAGQLSVLARLQRHTGLIDEVAEDLAGQEPRFGHGDPRPANVFWRPGRVQLIDWELAGRYPPLHDVSRVLAHLTRLVLFPALAGGPPTMRAAVRRSAVFRRAATAFVLAYARADGPFCPRLLGHSLAFAYVTLALETAARESAVSAGTEFLAGLGLQLMREPLRWKSFILPLEEDPEAVAQMG